MLRRVAWVAVLLPLLAVPTGLALGQPVPRSSDGAQVVELIVVGGRDGGALLDTVRELLGRHGLILEAHAVSGPADVAAIPRGSAVARIQVDLRASDEAVLVIEGRRQGPSQRVIRRDAAPVVAREEIAQAIESAVEAQLFADSAPPASSATSSATAPEGPVPSAAPSSSAPAASPSTEPPPPSAAPPPPPPPPEPVLPQPVVPLAGLPRETPAVGPRTPSSLGLDVSTLGGGGWFASATGPVATVGGNVTLASRRGWRPFLTLSGRAVLPFQDSAESVTARASAFAIRALAGVELLHTSWLALAAGAGGGTDVLWTTPGSAVLPPSVLDSPTTRADPIASALVAAHVALVPSVELTVMALGDLDLGRSRYVVAQGSTVEPVLAPWMVRPTLLAGFTFTAAGVPAFTPRPPR
jgi:hypothetical protein